MEEGVTSTSTAPQRSSSAVGEAGVAAAPAPFSFCRTRWLLECPACRCSYSSPVGGAPAPEGGGVVCRGSGQRPCGVCGAASVSGRSLRGGVAEKTGVYVFQISNLFNGLMAWTHGMDSWHGLMAWTHPLSPALTRTPLSPTASWSCPDPPPTNTQTLMVLPGPRPWCDLALNPGP